MHRKANAIFHTLVRTAVFALICVAMLLTSSGRGLAQDEPVRFQIDGVQIWFLWNSTQLSFPLAGTAKANNWEVKKLPSGLFQVRHASWPDFWQVDPDAKTVLRIRGGEFGIAAATGEPIEGVSLIKTASRFNIAFKNAVAVMDMDNNSFRIESDGAVLSEGSDWQLQCLTSDLCQFRNKAWKNGYGQYDLKDQTHVKHFLDQYFGKRIDNHRAISFFTVKPLGDIDQALDEQTIAPDIAFVKTPPVKSEWRESEKNLFRKLLVTQGYDTLVVPFQVSGYAIDRIGRSVMTRLLIDELAEASSQNIAPQTIVSKALGAQQRTYDPFEVYQLANELGVRKIIWCYAGHDLNLKLNVHFRIQEKTQEALSNTTPSRFVEKRSIPFDDIHLPEMAFQDKLPEIVKNLGYRPSHAKAQHLRAVGKQELPATFKDIVKPSKKSAAFKAYSLQLIGMLHPRESVDQESLFERSLALLRNAAEGSPDYPLLKARALFYLHRRPAAISTLGKPVTDEARFFKAFLDGDLENAATEAAKITSPVQRLIATIELEDLSTAYGNTAENSEILTKVVPNRPQWQMVVKRRLDQSDVWALQDNIEIKQLMDTLFPVPGFSAEDAAYRKMVLGRSTGDFELEPYHHVRQVLTVQPTMILAADSAGPIERDLLLLLNAVATENILKKIRFGFVQGNPADVIDAAAEVKSVYDGLPEIDYVVGKALYQLASNKNELEKTNLFKEINTLWKNAFINEQGQTWISFSTGKTYTQNYNYDFPRRAYWRLDNDPKSPSDRLFSDDLGFIEHNGITETPFDRKEFANLALALDYTHTNFGLFSYYYEKIKRLRSAAEAQALVDSLGNRFRGHPDKTAFLVKLSNISGNTAQADQLYRDAIARQPLSWKPYQQYFYKLLQDGRVDEAVRIAESFPPFSMTAEQLRTGNINRVGLSNNAQWVGNCLLSGGRFDLARGFLELSTSYNTGSGGEMYSDYRLAVNSGNYPLATKYALDNANRYKQAWRYAKYAIMLHLLGYHNEADAVNDTMFQTKNGREQYDPVIVGLRMTGKTGTDVVQWQLAQSSKEFSPETALALYFQANAMDRSVNKDFQKNLEKIQVWLQGEKKPEGLPSETLQKMVQQTDPFFIAGSDYYLTRTGQFEQAYKQIVEHTLTLPLKFIQFRFLIPYGAWCATQSGHANEYKELLENYKNEGGEDFDYLLAMAFIAGGSGQHKLAIEQLSRARYNLDNRATASLIPTRYQLFEACEWLYTSTGNDSYRELLLELSQAFRQTIPESIYAYAFAAKYEKSPEEKLRCLGITLYLDPQSSHLDDISAKEKQEARAWLNKNNPFLKQESPQQVAL